MAELPEANPLDANLPEARLIERFRLDGRTALITGGGRGIGRTIALAYAGAGAQVVVVSRTAAQVEHVKQEIESLGVRGGAYVADICAPGEVQRMAESVLADFGRVDILVNNAGNLPYKPLVPFPGSNLKGDWSSPGPTTDEEWFATFNTHVSGAFFAMRALVPGMLENGWGRVINMSSSARFRTVPFCSLYEMAKGALAALTRSLAYEWAAYNVTVNSISPGHFHTEMSAQLHEDPKSREWMLKRIPMRREGELYEVGAVALYLASDLGSYVTGQELFIDGGETL
jgi:NAD(P)-dependent dehydrogenase (short-subunit alcohol dehydrogenase family)